ncbi:hypothetical protein E2562_016325 [Oryza meyeriana var. granulata]|uniref:Carbohydrate binding domain-containing protein n=1 Tax=Oryza meyeriana var. granulata TaxID=110450 RepID=A0A6G1DY44_9ORYZ|nr:hypothetical protein E2562_016325 [Oryza meyeriana var. granulata]
MPHLCRTLESGRGADVEHARVALQPLTADSRDAMVAVAARGGVAALLGTCATGTPTAQAAATGVLHNLAMFLDLLPSFCKEGTLPSLLQLVSLGTPRAQELALACLQSLTSGDGDECQRLKVEAFQGGTLGCVKDFLESCVAADDVSPIEIVQNATASWKKNGRTYYRYSVTVTNRSGKTVEELHIGIGKPHGPVRGLDRARYGYVLPSLPAGKSAAFPYAAHASPPADVWFVGYKLV